MLSGQFALKIFILPTHFKKATWKMNLGTKEQRVIQ
ncbi:MAG: hypothetical protein JWQ09_914 [Segetibacter sp.]|nr:hypothetical protein [Segetibacter sp.]